MAFTYVIGEKKRKLTRRRLEQSVFFFCAEHMDEDDPTPHALPRWVELESKVRTAEQRASTLPSRLT